MTEDVKKPAEKQPEPTAQAAHADEVKKDATGSNPVLAIAVAIAIAALLSGISLITFLHSDTRQTIERIQQQDDSDSETAIFDGLDTTSRPTEEDLAAIQTDLQTSIGELNDETSFNAAELTDGALGL